MRVMFFFVLWLSFFCSAFAQNWQDSLLKYPVNSDGVVEYSEIVEVLEFSKSDIAKKCKDWFLKNYKSAKDVIQSETEDNISAKAIGSYAYYVRGGLVKPSLVKQMFDYAISVDFKDGRYRVVCNPVNNWAEAYPQYKASVSNWSDDEIKVTQKLKPKQIAQQVWMQNDRIRATNKYMTELLESLKKSVSKKDDW